MAEWLLAKKVVSVDQGCLRSLRINAFVKDMNPSLHPRPTIVKIVGQNRLYTFGRQPVFEENNSEFKLTAITWANMTW